jgi:Tfp pilus assembly protein PilF
MSELSDQRVKELELELEGNPFNMRALSEIARWYASRADYANACQNYEKIVRMDEENGKA